MAFCCRTIGLFEFVEDRFLVKVGNPDPAIFNADFETEIPGLSPMADVPALVRKCFDFDVNEYATRICELDRIADQIDQNLPDPMFVTKQGPGNIRIDIPDDIEPLIVGARGEKLDNTLHTLVEGEGFVLNVEHACFDF